MVCCSPVGAWPASLAHVSAGGCMTSIITTGQPFTPPPRWPLDTVAAALRLAREEGLLTMLDPAPAQPLPSELLARVDILTPNENEALMLLGRPPARVSRDQAPELAAALRELGVRGVVLKLGDQGSYYCGDTGSFHTPAFP